ncbi:L-threonine dehydratase catabolic TdcB [Trichostrongylus colubriformis]|uniref:L-serine deaminase n=1 Tax=Trichostrongylus colubriformis TaxID=6319 RepID=A0AAN8IBS5_TRICO
MTKMVVHKITSRPKQERKRTTSDVNDGLEYNKKVRTINREFMEQAQLSSPTETANNVDGHEQNGVGRNGHAQNGKKNGKRWLTTTDPPSGEEILVKDPDCDPDHPKKITFSDVSSAAFNIKNGVVRTPCNKSANLSRMLNMELYFKKEYLQVTGSFKERGARYALSRLTKEEKELGVIAASAGNHALALSYHGQQLNIPVTVVMPVFAPLMKIGMCRSYGANVILKGDNIGKAKEYAMRLVMEKKYKYINGYDAPDILAGQGTLGLEILEQVPDVDAIIVPVGGAGLIAGVAVAVKTLKPQVEIIGVESATCPSFTEACKAGKPVEARVRSSLADGLAVPVVGGNALATAQGLVDRTVVVSEEETALSILRLIEMEKAVVEGGGAVGLAALISGKLPELKGKKVVSILTGGNIDTTVLGRTIDRGLAVDGRLNRLEVVVSDRPGGIAELTTRIAHMGASIKDIFHERAWISTDVFSVKVKVVAETRDRQHVAELEEMLRSKYDDVKVS